MIAVRILLASSSEQKPAMPPANSRGLLNHREFVAQTHGGLKVVMVGGFKTLEMRAGPLGHGPM